MPGIALLVLTRARSSLPIALLTLVASGCSDSAPGDNENANSNGNSGSTRTVTATIGPEGGLVAMPGARLGIPEGALAEPTEITITCDADPPSAYEAFSPLCRFEPAGLPLGAPVTVELAFTGDEDYATAHWGRKTDGRYARVQGSLVAPGRIQFLITSLAEGFVAHRRLGTTESYLGRSARSVDLLFVVDNSGSMADEQAMLQSQFASLVQAMRGMAGGVPDLHIGVTSTDLGTSPYPITYCEEAGGDRGNLLTGNCTNPTGAPYIVDAEPFACEITKDAQGNCSTSTCSQLNCEHEPTTSLVTDIDTGCPRCRNYAAQSLEEVFSCMAILGTQGCGFEQPLEAMVWALEPANSHNAGFSREEAMLAVLLVTDEDDCSASDPYLFDNTQTDLTSELGPLTSFRCFELGITCDVNDRTTIGPRQDCVPREDPAALLYPPSRYISFLEGLKPREMLTVAAIAGPVVDQQVTVGLDEYSQPELEPSCSTERGGAVPGIRIKAVIEAFNAPEEMDWAYTSICSQTFEGALGGVAERIQMMVEQGFRCFPGPILGCGDIGAEYGVPLDGQSCNDECRPFCHVSDVTDPGGPTERWTELPPCLEVCNDGPCPGSSDRTLSYQMGHPLEVDANLPVPACWHIAFDEKCDESRHARIVVSRQVSADLGVIVEASCLTLTSQETDCSDGLDNDGDCLVDELDPDCVPTP